MKTAFRRVMTLSGAVLKHNRCTARASLQKSSKNRRTKKDLGEDVKFYLEFFKYGCPPHGGFGLGVDRLTMLLLGLNIKEAMFRSAAPDRLKSVKTCECG